VIAGDSPPPIRRPRRRDRIDVRLRPWIVFAGCVLILVVLDWAKPVLIPVALAVLLTFLLNPAVSTLERWIRRLPAVLLIVSVSLLAVALSAWTLADQMVTLADALPAYRQNIRQKAADVRGMSENGSIERVQGALDDIRREWSRGRAPAATTRTAPDVVAVQAPDGFFGLPAWLEQLFNGLGSAALVTILVTFMLLEYRELRDRLIAVIGHGYVANTTRAFDEAASRVSRYLALQTLVNLIYGTLVFAGLWMIGVPYPMLWGATGAVLRFIPYLGPWIAAGLPTLVSLAAFPGWIQPLWTAAWFVVLELFTNLVLETVLYAGAAGVSQAALLVAVAFWTWIWGPIGLLMATPLTVCVVVIGKHVPGLWFLSMLLADRPALRPDETYYQRLLAGEQGDAMDLVEEFMRSQPADQAFDALLLPALNYAERDRRAGRISSDEERTVAMLTRDLIGTVGTPALVEGGDAAAGCAGAHVLGCASDTLADEIGLDALEAVLRPLGVMFEKAPGRLLASEILDLLHAHESRIVCLVDLPPKSPSRARYLVKRLRQARPDLAILVGRWAPESVDDESPDALVRAGANEISTSILDMREQVRKLCAQEA
jgi:predicted PurR-regulated permease PerM